MTVQNSRSSAVMLLVALLLLPPARGDAQQAVGDSLWRMGRRSEAVEEYLRIIAVDTNAVRANFRIAQDLAGRNVDSALVYLRNARKRVPDDPDLMFAEGTYLSWAKRYDEAILRFDSVLAVHPEFAYVRIARARVTSWKGDLAGAARGYDDVLDRTDSDAGSRGDANFGLAQVAGWQGNLVEAESRYRAILADRPDEVRALVGLGAVHSWQGRPIAARNLLVRAVSLDSTNGDATGLLETVARSTRPTLDVSISWSNDSDDNQVSWQNATQSFLLRDGLRAWATAGLQRASDPSRRTTRMLGELGGSVNVRGMRLTAAFGARQLGVDLAPGSFVADRTVFTWRAGGSGRVLPNLSVGASASHVPFDEIAALLVREINLSSYDGSAEWNRGKTAVSASAGMMDFSDGNRRTSAMLRVTRRIKGALSIGVAGRTFSFEKDGLGYFTPEQFVLADLFAGWEREIKGWSTGISAGGGIQRIEPGNPVQEQWHADARLSRQLSSGASIGVQAGVSTSVAASAVGAFRYETFGMNVRIPF